MIMMARYNVWADEKLLALIRGHVTDEEFTKNTGVVFRSIHGTLAHIYLAETVWYSSSRLLFSLVSPPGLLSSSLLSLHPSLTFGLF